MSALYQSILLLSGLLFISACPQFVSELCRCEDLHNGVKLDCSNVDAVRSMQIIRNNQANIGLIQELILRNASLTKLPAGLFNGLYIKTLDISMNNLEDIDVNAFLGMNNVLHELVLNHNNLTSLPALAFAPLNALHKLDLSNNSLTDLLATHAFPPLPKLFDLNLADNFICEIHKSVFDHVKTSLQTVNLGRNCLGSVPASAIRGFRKLMALHLHGNNITALNPLSFMNLPSMNLLNLASNRITTIHRQAFLNVPHLKYLYLTGNRITEVYPHQFGSFEELEMLDFSGNYLLEIVTDAFSNLGNLRQLYIGENRITNIQTNAFANSSVVLLALSSNQLTELKDGMFDGMAKLQQVSLKDNQIHAIDQNVFYSCPSLVMIDLSENDLTDITPTTFLTQINILLIDLSKNKLLRTPYGAFNRRTKTVLLQENPLVCTEKIHMLQEGVGVFIPNSEDAVCGPKPQMTDVTPANNEDEQKEAVKPVEEESVIPAQPEEKSTFVQDTGTLHRIRPPVIKPLSTVAVKDTEPNSSVAETNDRLIPIRPINIPPTEQPTLGNTEAADPDPEKPTAAGEVVASRSRSNFGLAKPRNHFPAINDKDETTTRKVPSIVIHQQHPINDQENSANEPDVPFPFQISNPTPLAPAFAATTTATLPQTLPSNIVVAQGNFEPSDDQTLVGEKKIEKVELDSAVSSAKKSQEIEQQLSYENEKIERQDRIAAPTIIIIVCLSTVAIVMSAVFIGLCVAKHRSMRLYGESSSSSAAAARTSAYVAAQAAQAAQMNMLYGTHRNRSGSSLNYIDDNHAWIYAPGSYSQTYYK